MKYTTLTPLEIEEIKKNYNSLINLEMLIANFMYHELFQAYLSYKRDHKLLSYFTTFKDYKNRFFCQDFLGIGLCFSRIHSLEGKKALFIENGNINNFYRKYLKQSVVEVIEGEELLWLNDHEFNVLNNFFKHLEYTDAKTLGVTLHEKDVNLLLKLDQKYKLLFKKASEWKLFTKQEDK